MDIVKREKEYDVFNFNDTAQIICEICGISGRENLNINIEPAPPLYPGIKSIYLDDFH